MSHSLQLFVYNTKQIIVPYENNYPILNFETKVLACEFIRNLKSRPTCSIKEPYFVINNMQLIPSDFRNLHTYKKYIIPNTNNWFVFNKSTPQGRQLQVSDSDSDTDTDSDIEQDYNGNKYIICDGCFSIADNLNLLKMCDINNNTTKDTGFCEYLDYLLQQKQTDEDELQQSSFS
jgi:hypothetical protein